MQLNSLDVRLPKDHPVDVVETVSSGDDIPANRMTELLCLVSTHRRTVLLFQPIGGQYLLGGHQSSSTVARVRAITSCVNKHGYHPAILVL